MRAAFQLSAPPAGPVRGLLLLCAFLLLGLAGVSAQTLPDPPRFHVLDQAGALSGPVRDALVARLEAFERESSSQVVVWISPALPSGAALDDHVLKVFQHWKVGQKGKDNGVLLAIFRNDRKMRIEVGYGLEGSLPDALAGRIIANEIAPRLRTGDFDGGVKAGVEAILAATRGEYRGTGTVGKAQKPRPALVLQLLILVVVIGLIFLGRFQRSSYYDGRGRRVLRDSAWGIPWGGGGFGGGGGGGGGGFGGGGGSSGGGGASGGW